MSAINYNHVKVVHYKAMQMHGLSRILQLFIRRHLEEPSWLHIVT